MYKILLSFTLVISSLSNIYANSSKRLLKPNESTIARLEASLAASATPEEKALQEGVVYSKSQMVELQQSMHRRAIEKDLAECEAILAGKITPGKLLKIKALKTMNEMKALHHRILGEMPEHREAEVIKPNDILLTDFMLQNGRLGADTQARLVVSELQDSVLDDSTTHLMPKLSFWDKAKAWCKKQFTKDALKSFAKKTWEVTKKYAPKILRRVARIIIRVTKGSLTFVPGLGIITDPICNHLDEALNSTLQATRDATAIRATVVGSGDIDNKDSIVPWMQIYGGKSTQRLNSLQIESNQHHFEYASKFYGIVSGIETRSQDYVLGLSHSYIAGKTFLEASDDIDTSIDEDEISDFVNHFISLYGGLNVNSLILYGNISYGGEWSKEKRNIWSLTTNIGYHVPAGNVSIIPNLQCNYGAVGTRNISHEDAVVDGNSYAISFTPGIKFTYLYQTEDIKFTPFCNIALCFDPINLSKNFNTITHTIIVNDDTSRLIDDSSLGYKIITGANITANILDLTLIYDFMTQGDFSSHQISGRIGIML